MTSEVHPALDAVDLRLLSALEADPRMSVRGIARAVGMSAGAVGERLDRLQARGVIRGFSVDIDPSALGLHLEVGLGLQIAQSRPLDETIDDLLEIPWIEEVQVVTGRWDLFVFLLVRDHAHLREALAEIWNLPDTERNESIVVLSRHPARRGVLRAMLNQNVIDGVSSSTV